MKLSIRLIVMIGLSLLLSPPFLCAQTEKAPAPDATFQWKLLGLARERIDVLAIDPTNPDILYAGVVRGERGFETGLFKSSDAGKQWKKVYDKNITHIAVDPTNSQTIYTGWGVLLKSIDGGDTWTDLNLRLSGGIVIDPSNPSIVYAGGLSTARNNNGVLYSGY